MKWWDQFDEKRRKLTYMDGFLLDASVTKQNVRTWRRSLWISWIWTRLCWFQHMLHTSCMIPLYNDAYETLLDFSGSHCSKRDLGSHPVRLQAKCLPAGPVSSQSLVYGAGDVAHDHLEGGEVKENSHVLVLIQVQDWRIYIETCFCFWFVPAA